MSSNGNSGGGSSAGGNSDNSNSNTYIAIVALVISIIAFLATSAQVVQQYLASAHGYSQCNEKVMGLWAKTRRRKLIWYETRFEVEFDTPVIFACPPDNDRGPLDRPNGKKEPIYLATGTPKSYDETWTTREEDPRGSIGSLAGKEQSTKSEKEILNERIHTADNERASWSVLLSAVQSMEKKSAAWQKDEYSRAGPRGKNHNLPDEPPGLQDFHTLVVALQRKRRSWDTMPTSVTKPYATTTICHLVEIMAALGVYWQEFDRKNDRYRAEGNGYMVLGERVSDLGLMFSFQLYGRSRFERNRIIPVKEVKDLCFGCVPTIFRSAEDEAIGLNSLAMATQREVSETLTAIGCNKNTVHYFLEEGSRTSHLFPVTFELVGMVSQTFHIPNSSFTYIPNPTADRWVKRSVSLAKMMDSYFQLFKISLPEVERNETISDVLNDHMVRIRGIDEENPAYHLNRANALHAALDDLDEILTARVTSRNASDSPIYKAVSQSSAEEPLPEDREKQNRRRVIVQDVLRSHIQEVLLLLNFPDDLAHGATNLQVPQNDGSPSRPFSGSGATGGGGGGPHYHRSPRSPSRRARSRNRAALKLSTETGSPASFEDMNDASPDERQQKFMEVYFERVRSRVVTRSYQSTERRASLSARSPITIPPFPRFQGGAASATATGASGAPAPAGFGFRRRETSKTTSDGDVVFTAVKETAQDPRRSLDEAAIKNAPFGAVADESTMPKQAQSQAGGDAAEPADTGEADKPDEAASPIEPTLGEASDDSGERPWPLADEPVSHDDIWCALVLRMICWLMLHDFDKADVQVPKSELRGSRMPVYIS